MSTLRTDLSADAVIKDLVQCGYVKAADLADRYGNAKQALNPDIDAEYRRRRPASSRRPSTTATPRFARPRPS